MCLTEIFSALTGGDREEERVAPEPVAPTLAEASQAETKQRRRRAGAVGRGETILSNLSIETKAVSDETRKAKLGS